LLELNVKLFGDNVSTEKLIDTNYWERTSAREKNVTRKNLAVARAM
jgi:hypothetical protein